jgi:Flp pilus assembly protein TadG
MKRLEAHTPTGSVRTGRLSRALAAVRRERGVAVVEFALLVPLLLLIVFGILDFGRAMNYKNELTQIANQVARSAAVDRSPIDGTSPFPSCGALKSYFSNTANVDTPEIANMIQNGTIAITPGTTVGYPVTVKFTAAFSFLPFIASPPPLGVGKAGSSLSGQATMRLEQMPTFGAASC